jgi:enamine deaminase RidA (YjgF/YER057c/UK114 family)
MPPACTRRPIEGRLAFLAGQGPILNGTVVGGPIAEQTRVMLQNLVGILGRLGAESAADTGTPSVAYKKESGSCQHWCPSHNRT